MFVQVHQLWGSMANCSVLQEVRGGGGGHLQRYGLTCFNCSRVGEEAERYWWSSQSPPDSTHRSSHTGASLSENTGSIGPRRLRPNTWLRTDRYCKPAGAAETSPQWSTGLMRARPSGSLLHSTWQPRRLCCDRVFCLRCGRMLENRSDYCAGRFPLNFVALMKFLLWW